MTDSARFSWTVLLPVKVLAHAKSRLAALAGDRRGELAIALASDTVVAAVRCPEVARVIVITSDQAAGPLLAALGAIIVPDEPADRQAIRVHRAAASLRTSDTAPQHPDNRAEGVQPLSVQGDGPQEALNAALRHGAAVAASRWPGTGVAALTADLPALDPAELSAALRAAASLTGRPAFVPDAAGVGTTLYAVPPGGEFRPQFGGASRARHAAAGATELDFDVMTGLRRDVDAPDDLRTALALSAGPRTRATVAQLRPQPSRPGATNLTGGSDIRSWKRS